MSDTESSRTETILRVRNLQTALGGAPVLSDVSFQVNRGEFLAILGPNGSGKSTLLRTLVGALPYSGEVLWEGKRLRVSYLPEDLAPQKFRELPITIKEFFRSKKASPEKTLEIFSLVGLNERDVLNRNPGELSTGQFQRMLIAWSLVDNPDVLLFDEPTLGIDIGGEETIYTLLSRFWKERGLTILLVTHELNVVYAYATHVLCLKKKKLFYGAPREILTLETLRELYGPSIKFHVPHD